MGLDLGDVLDPTGSSDRAENVMDPLHISPRSIYNGEDPLNVMGRTPDTPPNQADIINAGLSREQYRDWRRRYAPIEREHLRTISSPNFVRNGVRDARQRINDSEQISKGITDRSISRAGLNVSPAQAQALERMRKLGFAKDMTYGLQTARDTYSDMQLEGLNTAVGYGRGLEKDATNISGNLAQQGARRDAANRTADAQEDAQNQSTAASLIMMAAYMWSSGKYKENIRSADQEELHRMVIDTPVYEFDYREDAPAEVAGNAGNIGTIVENAPEKFIAAGGDKVNVNNLIFALLASHQYLTKKVQQLEARG